MAAFDLPVSVSAVEAFERNNRVELPEAYRWFVTHVVSGGPGPANGLLPFRHSAVDGRFAEPWIDPVAWNANESGDGGLYDGVLPVADLGCGSLAVLVLNGPHAGEVWNDFTAGSEGFERAATDFITWYSDWLDAELHRAPSAGTANELDGAFSEAMSSDSTDPLMRAMHQLGHAGDPRFRQLVERAITLDWLSVHAAPTYFEYAVALDATDLMSDLVEQRLSDSEVPALRMIRALLRSQSGELTTAVAEWSELQEDGAFEPTAWSMRMFATALLESGDTDAAVGVYVDADDWVWGEPADYADHAMQAGLHERAVNWCEAVLERLDGVARDELDEDDLEEHERTRANLEVARIRARMRLGQRDVDDELDAAVSRGAHVRWDQLALEACESGAFELGLRFLDNVDGRPGWCANLRGCCFDGLERFDEGLAAFEESLGYRNWIVPFENRAYPLIRLGRFEEAEAVLDAVDAFEPAFQWTHYHRAVLALHQGAVDEARQHIYRATELGFDIGQADPNVATLMTSDQLDP